MWHSRDAPALWYVTSTVFDYGPFLFLQIFLYRITTAFKIKNEFMSHSHGMYFDKSRNANHAVALSAVIDGCRKRARWDAHL